MGDVDHSIRNRRRRYIGLMPNSPASNPRSLLLPVRLTRPARTDRRPLSRLILMIVSFTIFVSSDAFSSDLIESEAPRARRAEGLAFVDLPLNIRARFDVTYSDDLYRSDALARPYATVAGPRIRDDESLESQFALTRSLSENVEIGIVWAARSPVAPIDLFDFHHQTIGAMIRIVP